MIKDIFPKPHKHEIEKDKLKQYKSNLNKKGKRFKSHHSIETFDSKQVLKMLSKKSVTRLGVVQGADDAGQRISILVAYNSAGNIVGKALQTADPCPPPPCEDK
ncbi:MAG: hypothetical protein KDC88_17145 [Ignavibacteriae bacterium]|nr:hypothetical protein [Ignavibacteriota bacterium]MCB9208613.1 hypothetical protein [Ignavibacteriales bacterium]MCB9258277.1 hypothetical protein [Ignavibacteriales bacterium]